MTKRNQKDLRNKNKGDNMTSTKEHNTSKILEHKNEEIDKMSEYKFKNIIIRLPQNNQKQMQEFRHSTYGKNEKFSHKIDILGSRGMV